MTLTSLSAIPSKLSKVSLKSSKFLAKNKRFFSEDPNFFWMQYFARFQFVREWSARQHFESKDVDESVISSASVSIDHKLGDVHKILWNDGYYQGIRLASEPLDTLLHFAKTHPCYGDRDPEIQFTIDQQKQVESELGRSFKIASYFDSHESCETFQKLKQDPLLRAIAAEYLGHEPKYHRGELMWSFPQAVTQEEKIALAQVLHCDINDYKTVKFFFYLTEVDLESGPHVYVKGSHRNRNLWHQLIGQSIASIPDESLIQNYGEEHVVTACGPAGFGMVGDPYVLHRGITPSKRARLLLQLEFGMNSYKTWYFSVPNS